MEKPVRRQGYREKGQEPGRGLWARCRGVHGAGRDFVGPNWQGPGMDWVRDGGAIEGVGRNPQEGGDLRLQYCPELGSVPVDNMFVV